MIFLRILLTAIAGWSIANGGSVEPNWVLVSLGLCFWWYLFSTASSTRLAVVESVLIWFLASYLGLDWLTVIGEDARFALSLLVALGWGLIAWLLRQFDVNSLGNLRAAILAGGVVVFVEFLAGRYPFGGFSWFRVSYLLADSPLAFVSAWFGVGFFSFFTVFLAVFLVNHVSHRKIESFIQISFVLMIIAVWQFIPIPNFDRDVTAARMNVLAIQGGVPRVGLDFNSQRAAVLNNHVQGTILADIDISTELISKPDLVLWPENASDIDPFITSGVSNLLQQLAKRIDAPILLGAVLRENDYLRNASVLATDKSIETVYIKQKLVPFGEYLPFRSYLEKWINRFEKLPTDFKAGEVRGIVSINSDFDAGVLICYEVAYDKYWEQISKDADVFLVQTNNATYGKTTQPFQQMRITSLYAIQEKSPVVVASTSGISAVINSDGSIKDMAPEFQSTYLSADLDLRSYRTLGSVVNLPLQYLLSLWIFLKVLMSLFRRKNG